MMTGATHHASPWEEEGVVWRVESTAGPGPLLTVVVGDAEAVVDGDALEDGDAEADPDADVVTLADALALVVELGCDPDDGCALAEGRGDGDVTGLAPQVPDVPK